MADISANFLGIKSPNPFWLASAPPTDKLTNVLRAFEAGWGGVVWKTLGSQVKNVSSRYSAVNYGGKRVMGLNNIELISDRPLELNLREIREAIRLFPD
ncbi:MAG: NAD-dependent dihydropyrimidine dehydrogenase subunit PreA, partial [Burkholderiales bacterium]